MDIATYNITFRSKNGMTVCYNKTKNHSTGLWRAENPLVSTLPLLIIQLLVIILFSRVLAYLLKPLRQPRIVANILGGILLGPSFLGFTPFARVYVVPFHSISILETLANLALVYYMFLVGLELDIRPLVRAGTRALSISVAGFLFAVPVGWALHTYLLFRDFDVEKTKGNSKQVVYGPIFWGLALASTNFVDLAQILADLKLLHLEIGQLALSVAVISDLLTWFLFLVAMTLVGDGKLYTMLFTLAFIAFGVLLLRPALAWIIRYTTKEDSYSDVQTCFILFGIVLCGLITDACGVHSIVGSFVLGAIMPKGIHFKSMFVERVGNFVTTFLMPLLYLVIGLRFDSTWLLGGMDPLDQTHEQQTGSNMPRLVGVIILAFATKIISTFVLALINKMTPRDSIVLGFMMNTKGLLALIILSSARDLKALDNQTFAVMLVAVWAMTIPIGPFLALIYKSIKSSRQYKHRSIPSVGLETELRILVCTHTASNASGIIDLIEASNPSRKSPIHVFVVQLVELTDHSAAMLIVHDACKTTRADGNDEVQSDFTSNAFENYAKQRENVSVQALIAVSAYATMHEDICNLADEKHVNFIILQFRKQTTIDGAPNGRYDPLLGKISKKVIENAKCFVGVFVDCGLVPSRMTESINGSLGSHNFAMFFIGGPNDREALGYAWRMAGHPRVNLMVVRFTLSKEAWGVSCDNDNDNEYEAKAKTTRQKQLDDLCMDEFKLKSMSEPSIKLCEEQVNNCKEILNIISTMEGQYQLYIVGRGHDITSPLFECSNTDVLGALGEALMSSGFIENTSLLIMQQGAFVDELDKEEKMGYVGEQSGHTTWQPPVKDTKDSLLQTLQS